MVTRKSRKLDQSPQEEYDFLVFLLSCHWIFVRVSNKIIKKGLQAYFEGRPERELRLYNLYHDEKSEGVGAKKGRAGSSCKMRVTVTKSS